MDALNICILLVAVRHAAAFTREARTGGLHIPEKIIGGVMEIVQSHKNKPLGFQQYQQYGQPNQLQFQNQYASGYQHGYNQASLPNYNQGTGQSYPLQGQGFNQGQYQNGLNTQNNNQYQPGGNLGWNQNQYQQGNQGQYVANQGPQYQGQSNQNQFVNNQYQNGQFGQNQNGQFNQNQNGQLSHNGQFNQNQNGQFSQNQNGQYIQSQYQNGQNGQNFQTSNQFQGQYGQGTGCVCQKWRPQADESDTTVKVKQDVVNLD